jgi:hypothetical protein
MVHPLAFSRLLSLQVPDLTVGRPALQITGKKCSKQALLLTCLTPSDRNPNKLTIVVESGIKYPEQSLVFTRILNLETLRHVHRTF